MGINGAYIRGITAAGYANLPMHKLVELKAVGVTPADIARIRKINGRLPSVHKLVEIKALGIDPDDIDVDVDVNPDPDPDPDHDPDPDPDG